MKLHNNVKPENEFFLQDGRQLKNLKELVTALNTMDEATFSHHVNENKNDFHNWIRDVYEDKHFARKLLMARTRQETAYQVQRRIMEIKVPQAQEIKLTYAPQRTTETPATPAAVEIKTGKKKEAKTKPLRIRLRTKKRRTGKKAKTTDKRKAGKAKTKKKTRTTTKKTKTKPSRIKLTKKKVKSHKPTAVKPRATSKKRKAKAIKKTSSSKISRKKTLNKTTKKARTHRTNKTKKKEKKHILHRIRHFFTKKR